MDISQHSLQKLTDLSIHFNDPPPPVEHIYMTNHDVMHASNTSYHSKAMSELDNLNSSRSCHDTNAGLFTEETILAPSFKKEEPPLETGTSSCISALMITNRRKSPLNESASRSAHSSYDGEMRDRSKKFSSHRSSLLEQSKNRSWSNMSHYNSSTARTSLRNSRAASSRNDYLDLQPTKDDRAAVFHLSAANDPYRQCFKYAGRNKRTSAKAAELESLSAHLKNMNMGDDVSRPRDVSRPVNRNEVITEPNSTPPELENPSQIEGKSMLVIRSRRESKVVFSTVEVRQYERILGDNPAVSYGPPLSIGWKHYEDRTICVTVDEYEYYHGTCEDLSDMVLTRYEREVVLFDLGYDEREIAKTIRQNYKLKKNRRQTVNNLPIMSVEQAVESAKKSLSRMILSPVRKQISSKSMYREWKKNKEDGLFPDTSSASTFNSERSILKTGPSSQASGTLFQASQPPDVHPNKDHLPKVSVQPDYQANEKA